MYNILPWEYTSMVMGRASVIVIDTLSDLMWLLGWLAEVAKCVVLFIHHEATRTTSVIHRLRGWVNVRVCRWLTSKVLGGKVSRALCPNIHIQSPWPISMHFLIVLVGRIFKWSNWFPFGDHLLILEPFLLILCWYCEKKFDVGHSWGL